jgi:uncharacterized membrane protein YczE
MVGGLLCLATGVDITVMVALLGDKPGTWTAGLVPLLIGVVLTAVAVSIKPSR